MSSAANVGRLECGWVEATRETTGSLARQGACVGCHLSGRAAGSRRRCQQNE